MKWYMKWIISWTDFISSEQSWKTSAQKKKILGRNRNQSDLCCLAIYNFIYLYSTLHQSSGKKKQLEIWLILVSQELFERELVVHFLLHHSRKSFVRKGFDPEIRWEIYLVTYRGYLTRSVLLVCTHGMPDRKVFFASNRKYIVCFNKTFRLKSSLWDFSAFADSLLCKY